MKVSDLRKIGQEYAIAFGTELVRQGRNKRTGGLISSLKVKAQIPNMISIWGNHYWAYVDKGVRASKIPFSGTRRGGGKKKSKYIQGIIRWLKQRGIGSSEAVTRGIAFAIAYTHKKVGMPSSGGRRDKSRMNFVDKALHKADENIQKKLDLILGYEVERILKKL